MKHYQKYYRQLMSGGKLPRKAKKAILGTRQSKSRLRKRIAAVKITGDLKTIYDGFCINDAFCPECGCAKYTRSGNRAEYPELWETLFCARCGSVVAEADNSPYYHVLWNIACERESRERKLISQHECSVCGSPVTVFCDVCDAPLCSYHARRVGDDTDVCPTHDNPEDIEKAIERRAARECEYDYETTYGHCLAKNPYWFIPDTECNLDEELQSWRHALFAVDNGTFESPEHFFWKTVDTPPNGQEIADMMNDCGGVLSTMGTEDGKTIIHGHNTPWGMGISAFSDKINVWDEYPTYKWLLDMAKSDISDEDFLSEIKKREQARKRGDDDV